MSATHGNSSGFPPRPEKSSGDSDHIARARDPRGTAAPWLRRRCRWCRWWTSGNGWVGICAARGRVETRADDACAMYEMYEEPKTCRVTGVATRLRWARLLRGLLVEELASLAGLEGEQIRAMEGETIELGGEHVTLQKVTPEEIPAAFCVPEGDLVVIGLDEDGEVTVLSAHVAESTLHTVALHLPGLGRLEVEAADAIPVWDSDGVARALLICPDHPELACALRGAVA